MFVDSAQIRVKAGNGGNGLLSWRKEKFVDRGGPDGGDGGKGGSVIAVGDNNVNGLGSFRINRQIKAEPGESGGNQKRHGANGEDAFIKVPLGTEIWQEDEMIADITAVGQQVVIAKGGDGGYGNAHFVSSKRQAPNFAEKGEPGEEKALRLELKLLADVGLIGLPNAGKSTFLSMVTSAKPKIANYPFTTLAPNVGVADVEKTSLLIADIPGLIEGAAEGKGLGDEFLRHVERTAVLLHLIDISDPNYAKNYNIIIKELAAYKLDLSQKPQVVAMTKIDLVEDKEIEKAKKAIKKLSKSDPLTISNVKKIGLKDLLNKVKQKVQEERAVAQKIAEDLDEEIPVYSLKKSEPEWTVIKLGEGSFKVKGKKIEKFAIRTDFSSHAAMNRLRIIMRKMGITHELERQGAKVNDSIAIGPNKLKL